LSPPGHIHIRKLRRVFQALDERQARRLLRHALDQELRPDPRIVDAGQYRAALAEQLRQAAQDLRVVLGQGKAALLEARRVDDDQVIRRRLAHLAPRLEQLVPKKPDAAQVMPVQPVIITPAGQRGLRHVEVDHLLRPTGNRCHREAAGIGEQVEHPLVRRVLAYPAPAIAHIEEQAVVLFQAEVELVAQPVLVDDLVRAGLAQQPVARAVRQVTMLDQHRHVARRQPAQHVLQRRELPLGRLAEQPHQQHTLKPVHGDLLQSRPAAPATVEQPPGFTRRRVQGGAQVLMQGVDGSGHGRCSAG